MERAAILARYYAAEAARLASRARVDARLAEAERLRTWLMEAWDEPLVSIRAIIRFGPNALRQKSTAERCVAILADHGWLLNGGGGEVGGDRAREAWRIIRSGACEKVVTPATVATLATKQARTVETVATVATVAGGKAENTRAEATAGSIARQRGRYADTLLELAERPPPDCEPEPWRDACEGAANFDDGRGPAAIDAGWTLGELYGAHPADPLGRPSMLGAALRIGRAGVLTVTPEAIVIVTATGEKRTLHKPATVCPSIFEPASGSVVV